jgi:hypothetical protein
MLAVFLHLLGFTVTGPITPGLVTHFGMHPSEAGGVRGVSALTAMACGVLHPYNRTFTAAPPHFQLNPRVCKAPHHYVIAVSTHVACSACPRIGTTLFHDELPMHVSRALLIGHRTIRTQCISG